MRWAYWGQSLPSERRYTRIRCVNLPLTHRTRSVLYAVVSEFIATGEPVGSRTLAKKYRFGVSPATIRNVLADLEDLGYLVQPYTSAGRVPTELAFRVFIDALMKVRRLGPEQVERIAGWLEGLSPETDILSSTGQFLSDLVGVPAVVARHQSESRTLRKIHFISTRPGELLSVLMFSDGTVGNRYIRVEPAVTDRDLERLHGLLDEVVQGKTLTELHDHFERVRDASRDELLELYRVGLSLVTATQQGRENTSDFVVEGRARLLDHPQLSQRDQLKEAMRTLEDRQRIVTMLNRTLVAHDVQVFLGEELGDTAGVPMSLVAAAFTGDRGSPGGAVGVIGPTRMDYQSVVPLVGATADAVGAALARAEGRVLVKFPSSRRFDDDDS